VPRAEPLAVKESFWSLEVEAEARVLAALPCEAPFVWVDEALEEDWVRGCEAAELDGRTVVMPHSRP
jgi:hypothetical protein